MRTSDPGLGKEVRVSGLDRRECEARRWRWRTFLAIVLTLVAAGCSGGTSTPTHGQIAFASERDGNAEIYVVNDDGTGLTRLTRYRG